MLKDNFCSVLKQGLLTRSVKNQSESHFSSSAVLVPLVKKDGELSVLFEVRSSRLAWQPGEICFPGGRIEQEDENPSSAAVRETREELGLGEKNIGLIGELDYIVSPIGVILYPFAGCITDIAAVKPNPDEVAEVFTVPLSFLQHCRPRIGHMEMATRPLEDFPHDVLSFAYSRDWKIRTQYTVLFYEYRHYVIWGLTALVLQNFLAVCADFSEKF